MMVCHEAINNVLNQYSVSSNGHNLLLNNSSPAPHTCPGKCTIGNKADTNQLFSRGIICVSKCQYGRKGPKRPQNCLF